MSITNGCIFNAWVQETHCAVLYLRWLLNTALAWFAEGTRMQLKGRELCVKVLYSSSSAAWRQLSGPKEASTVPRRLLRVLSDWNDGPGLVEKPGGDPRLDIPVRHGLLDFRQQSVAGAPGGCQSVARRSVVQHRQVASAHFIGPTNSYMAPRLNTSRCHVLSRCPEEGKVVLNWRL